MDDGRKVKKLGEQEWLHLAACLGNVCTVEGVTAISDDIDYSNYLIGDGKIRDSDAPRF